MRTLARLTVIVTAAACAITASGMSSADPAANVSPAQIDSLVVPIDQIVPRMDYTTVSKVPAPSPATPQGAPSPADPCYLDALRLAWKLQGTDLQPVALPVTPRTTSGGAAVLDLKSDAPTVIGPLAA